jgi:hypothetical protein
MAWFGLGDDEVATDWAVRTEVSIVGEISLDDLPGLRRHLTAVGASVGADAIAAGINSYPHGTEAVDATLVVNADTVGAAVDEALRLMLSACTLAAITTSGLVSISAEPATLDPRRL